MPSGEAAPGKQSIISHAKIERLGLPNPSTRIFRGASQNNESHITALFTDETSLGKPNLYPQFQRIAEAIDDVPTINEAVGAIVPLIQGQHAEVVATCASPDQSKHMAMVASNMPQATTLVIRPSFGLVPVRHTMNTGDITVEIYDIEEADIMLTLNPELSRLIAPGGINDTVMRIVQQSTDQRLRINLEQLVDSITAFGAQIALQYSTSGHPVQEVAAVGMQIMHFPQPHAPAQPAFGTARSPQPQHVTPANDPQIALPGRRATWFDQIASWADTLAFDFQTRSISNVLAVLPESERTNILQQLRARHQVRRGETAQIIEALNALLRSQSSLDVKQQLSGKNIGTTHLLSILEDPLVLEIVDVMLDEPDRYANALSTIFTQIPIGKLPKEMSDKISAGLRQVDMDILPWKEGWYVCDYGEPRFASSVEKWMVLYLEDIKTLIKFDGKNAGLVLEDSRLPNGDWIHRGQIIAPLDSSVRSKMRAMAGAGKLRTSYSALPIGKQWAYQRRLKPYKGRTVEEQLQAYLTFAESLPAEVPFERRRVDEMERSEWIKLHKE